MARSWVAAVLHEIGRAELTASAQLGVSELVTNAILHSDPPVTVRVRGTYEHPRIEVTDRSLIPPQPTHELRVDDQHLSTVGRGLALVALHAAQWGSHIDSPASGKTVWFEPAIEMREEADLDGDLFDLDEVVRAHLEDKVLHTDLISVRLVNMPVELFTHLRVHYTELRRELRLLALADAEHNPLAQEVSATFLQIEAERRQAIGLADLDAAIKRGALSVDLDYAVPQTAPATMGHMRELLADAYATYGEQHLLALTPSPQLLALGNWYLGEFERQGRGEQPLPWSGSLTLEHSQGAS